MVLGRLGFSFSYLTVSAKKILMYGDLPHTRTSAIERIPNIRQPYSMVGKKNTFSITPMATGIVERPVRANLPKIDCVVQV